MKFEDIKLKRSERLTVFEGFAYTEDPQEHILRAWKIKKGEFIPLDIEAITAKCAEYIRNSVNGQDFLTGLLKDFLKVKLPPKALLDLHKRIQNKAKVKEKEGCYMLKIYGKKGRPFILNLVEN